MLRLMLTFLAGAGIVLTAACSESEGIELPTSAVQLQEAQVDTLLRAGNSGLSERERAVVRTEEEWIAFWERLRGSLAPEPAPPSVDFQEHMVIVAAMGSRPSGGFSIQVEGIHEDDGALHVVIHEQSPGRTCFVTAAITSPVVAVRVPRTDREVIFHERESVRECR